MNGGTVLALPYAGGGGQAYRSLFPYLGAEFRLRTLVLPGRDARYHMEPLSEITEMVRWLADDLGDDLSDVEAVFGHSMGAILAFELVRYLRRSAGWEPPRLVVSGRGAPHTDPRPDVLWHILPTPDLVARLRELGGSTGQDELWELVEPAVRADLHASETYRFEPGDPLRCPVLALGGVRDHGVPKWRLSAWRAHTSGPFASRLLQGDHFPFQSGPAAFARVVRTWLASPASEAVSTAVSPDETESR